MSDTDEATYDLAVIGGGFAGLAAARAAALRGLRVAVLEAKPALGARLHTTGIFVREAADACDIPARLARRVTRVRLYGPSRTSIDLDGPGYYFLTTDTAEVLRWLGEEARRAGANISTGCRLEALNQDGERWRLRAGGKEIRARYILGADGARSTAAAMLGLSRNRRFLAGVEQEYRDRGRLDPAFLHCFLDRRIAPGYIAWAVASPLGAQVGLAVSQGRKPKLERFTREAERLFELQPGDAAGRRSGLIPCGGIVPRWSRPGAMLVGDAAGMVSPLTGGGIHPALALGRRAGQAIADHLSGVGPAPELVLASELPRYGAKRVLRRLMDVAPPNGLIDRLLSTGTMARIARRIFFHQSGPARPAAPAIRSGTADSEMGSP